MFIRTEHEFLLYLVYMGVVRATSRRFSACVLPQIAGLKLNRFNPGRTRRGGRPDRVEQSEQLSASARSVSQGHSMDWGSIGLCSSGNSCSMVVSSIYDKTSCLSLSLCVSLPLSLPSSLLVSPLSLSSLFPSPLSPLPSLLFYSLLSLPSSRSPLLFFSSAPSLMFQPPSSLTSSLSPQPVYPYLLPCVFHDVSLCLR